MAWNEYSVGLFIIAAVGQMAGGMLWYGPLFGKPWMQAMGIDPEDNAKLEQMQKEAAPGYIASLIFALIFTYVLNVVFASLALTSLVDAQFFSHFTMGCGNDNLMGTWQQTTVAEPSVLALFGLGLGGLLFARRRQQLPS